MPSSLPSDQRDDRDDEPKPDRPLECCECKKAIATHYSEIVGHTITHTAMCAECPVLRRRLYGASPADITEGAADRRAGLACGGCGTALEEVRMGHSLGCSGCYEVFEEPLMNELRAVEKLPQRILSAKKNQPIYIGRTRGETQEISSSMRLLALNEALHETLKREDYEQAAWLRDQIKALTESQEKENRDG